VTITGFNARAAAMISLPVLTKRRSEFCTKWLFYCCFGEKLMEYN